MFYNDYSKKQLTDEIIRLEALARKRGGSSDLEPRVTALEECCEEVQTTISEQGEELQRLSALPEIMIAQVGVTTDEELKDALDAEKGLKFIMVQRPDDPNRYYAGLVSINQGTGDPIVIVLATLQGKYNIFQYRVRGSSWTATATPLQTELVSGESIKTINNMSLLGSGNIDIQGGGGGGEFVAYIDKPSGEVTTSTNLEEVREALESGMSIAIEDYTLENYQPNEQPHRLYPFAIQDWGTSIYFYCVSPISTLNEGYNFDTIRVYNVYGAMP